ncbi:MAG: YndJ family transporter [Pirellulales bacterium]
MIRLHTSAGRRAVVGAVVWFGLFGYLRPLPSHIEWAQMLLLLAALVLVPIGLRIARRPPRSRLEVACLRWIGVMQLPAAFALAVALLLPPGLSAALLAGCWFFVTLPVAIAGACRLWNHTPRAISDSCVALGMIYLAIGGGWAVLSCGGLRPLGFEPAIVLLTAIHFHYAGFLLPSLTGLAIENRTDNIARAAGIGVVAGVPLVAVGITATQLGFEPWLECAAAWITSVAGLLTAFLYWRLSRDSDIRGVVRLLWLGAALSLAFGMILSAMYGSRFYLPLTWLDIPWMRALHGTANAIGFGACGVFGWWIAKRVSDQ